MEWTRLIGYQDTLGPDPNPPQGNPTIPSSSDDFRVGERIRGVIHAVRGAVSGDPSSDPVSLLELSWECTLRVREPLQRHILVSLMTNWLSRAPLPQSL